MEASEVPSWGRAEGFVWDVPSRGCWAVLGRAAALAPFVEGTRLQSLEGRLLTLHNSALTLKVPIWSLTDKADDALGTGMTWILVTLNLGQTYRLWGEGWAQNIYVQFSVQISVQNFTKCLWVTMMTINNKIEVSSSSFDSEIHSAISWKTDWEYCIIFISGGILSGLLLKTAKQMPPGNHEQFQIIHMNKHSVITAIITQHYLEQANVLWLKHQGKSVLVSCNIKSYRIEIMSALKTARLQPFCNL